MRNIGIGIVGWGSLGAFHTLGLRSDPNEQVVANSGAGDERRAACARPFDSRPYDSIESNTIIDAACRSMRTGRWEPAERVEPIAAPLANMAGAR